MKQFNSIEKIKNNAVPNQLSPSFILRCSVVAVVLIFWAACGFFGYYISKYVSNHVNEPFFDFLPSFIKSFF